MLWMQWPACHFMLSLMAHAAALAGAFRLALAAARTPQAATAPSKKRRVSVSRANESLVVLADISEKRQQEKNGRTRRRPAGQVEDDANVGRQARFGNLFERRLVGMCLAQSLDSLVTTRLRALSVAWDSTRVGRRDVLLFALASPQSALSFWGPPQALGSALHRARPQSNPKCRITPQRPADNHRLSHNPA